MQACGCNTYAGHWSLKRKFETTDPRVSPILISSRTNQLKEKFLSSESIDRQANAARRMIQLYFGNNMAGYVDYDSIRNYMEKVLSEEISNRYNLDQTKTFSSSETVKNVISRLNKKVENHFRKAAKRYKQTGLTYYNTKVERSKEYLLPYDRPKPYAMTNSTGNQYTYGCMNKRGNTSGFDRMQDIIEMDEMGHLTDTSHIQTATYRHIQRNDPSYHLQERPLTFKG